MHPLNGDLPGPYVSVLVRGGALVAHRSNQNLAVPQYRRPFISLSVTSHSMVWDWRVSRAGTMLFIGLSCSVHSLVYYYLPLSVLSVCRLVLWGLGLRTDRVYITSLSLSFALTTFFNSNNNNNNNNNNVISDKETVPLSQHVTSDKKQDVFVNMSTLSDKYF